MYADALEADHLAGPGDGAVRVALAALTHGVVSPREHLVV